MKRHLIYYGDPCLREKSRLIETIDKTTLSLIEEMKQVMVEEEGIGLAACQIGMPVRLFLCCVTGLDEDGEPLYGKPKVYINPEITILDEKQWIDSEGCLSVPGFYEDVARPWKISIKALNEKGESFQEELEGWRARPILHEYDHLEGILFIDRIAPHRRRSLEPQLKKIKKRFSSSF